MNEQQKPAFIAVPFDTIVKIEQFMAAKPFSEVAGIFQELQRSVFLTMEHMELIRNSDKPKEE